MEKASGHLQIQIAMHPVNAMQLGIHDMMGFDYSKQRGKIMKKLTLNLAAGYEHCDPRTDKCKLDIVGIYSKLPLTVWATGPVQVRRGWCRRGGAGREGGRDAGACMCVGLSVVCRLPAELS